MMYAIIGLFALAAVMGLTVAIAILSKKPETPKAAVYAHGALGATALVLLIVYMMNNPENYPQIALILFVVAALGGFILFYNDVSKKKPGPVGLVVIHALVAVTAFVLLLFFAFF
ncbi:MAG: hypothetical protein ACOYXT_03420 [Bacteroidota bacterium]